MIENPPGSEPILPLRPPGELRVPASNGSLPPQTPAEAIDSSDDRVVWFVD